MKPFMLHHKFTWLPPKLQYRRTYSIGFKNVEYESFTFKLTNNSTHVIFNNNTRKIIVSKRKLKSYFKEGCLEFIAVQYE